MYLTYLRSYILAFLRRDLIELSGLDNFAAICTSMSPSCHYVRFYMLCLAQCNYLCQPRK
jgi:hypothetical protein